MDELAEKLGISSKTLGRYKNGKRRMPIDLYWKLVLMTRFTEIISILDSDLNRYWHVKKKKTKKDNTDDKDDKEDTEKDNDD